MENKFIKTKMILGNPVDEKLNISLCIAITNSVDKLVYKSVSEKITNSVFWSGTNLVYETIYDPIDELMKNLL
jgi:hypothetical protein